MRKFLIVFCATILAVGVASASPSVDIDEPQNQTYFNDTIPIDVSSDEVISDWNYSLNGEANVEFTPNITIDVPQGANNITIYATNNTGTTNSSTVYFTNAYIIVNVFDEETSENVSTGILVRLLNASSLVTIDQNNTDGDGSVHLIASSFDTYRVQGGGPAGTNYPTIRSFNFTFDIPTETVEMRLIRLGTGSFVTLQFVDSYYSVNLANVEVTWSKEGNVVDQQTSDTNGFVTEFLIPNTFYQVDSSREGYADSTITRTFVAGVFAVYMVRTDLDIVLDPAVVMFTYPARKTLYRNSTVSFAMDIFARDGDLDEYGIVIGYNPETIQNDDISFTTTNTRRILAIGTNPDGDYIFSTDGIQMRDWQSSDLYAGFYYVRVGVKRWRISKYPLDGVGAQSPYAIDLKAVLENNAAALGFTNTERAVKFFMLLLVGIISGGAADRKGKAFGLMAMYMSMGFFIWQGFLDKWMMVICVIVTGALVVDRYGGQYE